VGPGQRANTEIKNWKILRKIRATRTEHTLVKPVQTPILAD
jgi:hypothetical protein